MTQSTTIVPCQPTITIPTEIGDLVVIVLIVGMIALLQHIGRKL